MKLEGMSYTTFDKISSYSAYQNNVKAIMSNPMNSEMNLTSLIKNNNPLITFIDYQDICGFNQIYHYTFSSDYVDINGCSSLWFGFEVCK